MAGCVQCFSKIEVIVVVVKPSSNNRVLQKMQNAEEECRPLPEISQLNHHHGNEKEGFLLLEKELNQCVKGRSIHYYIRINSFLTFFNELVFYAIRQLEMSN